MRKHTTVLSALAAAAVLGIATAPLAAQDAHDVPPAGIRAPSSNFAAGSGSGMTMRTNLWFLDSPRSFAAPAAQPAGETPQSLRDAYGLPATGGSGAIAIVDAYDYPTAIDDLNSFSKQFGLPQEGSSSQTSGGNKVFQVVYASKTKPKADSGWAMEMALDIQWAHAMAPKAKIILVEAASSNMTDLLIAVQIASKLPGVKEVSMSWGAPEFAQEVAYDFAFTAPGVVYIGASGDGGGRTIFPGVSPNVVAVGGTRINRDAKGKFASEVGWSGSGGGKSAYEKVPSYQKSIVGIVGAARAVPDIAFNADPASGVAVYDTTPMSGRSGWFVVGGTSAAAPAIAGILNLAGHFYTSSRAELETIYSGLGSTPFRDITDGHAGAFSAGKGWDFVTGVGTPLGLDGK